MLLKALALLGLACLAAGQAGLAGNLAQTPRESTPGEPIGPLTTTLSLAPFATVRHCAPFAVLIKPGPFYNATVDADPAVLNNIKLSVINGVLSIEAPLGFSTTMPIQVTVELPFNALEAITLLGAYSSATVAPGFQVPTLAVSTAIGAAAGVLNVIGASIDTLAIVNAGLGDILIDGVDVGNVTLIGLSVGNTYINGLDGKLSVALSGSGNAIVGAESPDVIIDGIVIGPAKIIFNEGVCVVGQVGLSLGFPCRQAASLEILKPLPQWTCGLLTVGDFTCAAALSYGPFTPISNESSQQDIFEANSRAGLAKVGLVSIAPGAAPAPAGEGLQMGTRATGRTSIVNGKPSGIGVAPVTQGNALLADPLTSVGPGGFAGVGTTAAQVNAQENLFGTTEEPPSPFFLSVQNKVNFVTSASTLACTAPFSEIIMPIPGLLELQQQVGQAEAPAPNAAELPAGAGSGTAAMG